MTRRAGAAAAAAAAALLAAGCAVGPDYRRPEAPVPAVFKEQALPESKAAEPDRWKPAEPKDDAARGKWWEIFGDPALNALEEQVSVSNQSIAQAEATFRGARAAVRGARADFYPTVTTSPSATRSEGPAGRTAAALATSPASGPPVTVYQLPVDLSYELDVFGRIRRNVESNVANAQASAADLESVRLTMHAELAIDYFLLRGADAQIQLLDSTAGGYQKALQLTVNRHDQGVVSGVDVAQAETQLYTTQVQSIDVRLMRAQLEHAIAILTGKPPGDFEIPPAPVQYSPPSIPVGLPSELLERRPEIAAAERRVASANAQIGVATAAFFPRLLLAATGGYESTRLSDWFSLPARFWSIGPSLLATLFDGGRRRSVREQAVAAHEGAVAAYRFSVLSAFQEVEDNVAAVRILTAEAALQTNAVASAERALALAQNRYQGGITTYLEVVTAQNAALANERLAVDVLTRRMTASVNLVKALGGGWLASDLPYGGAASDASSPGSRSPAAAPAPGSPPARRD
jgi:NodT family efflux transporter outer membrane factor (OMF) lipoprotein